MDLYILDLYVMELYLMSVTEMDICSKTSSWTGFLSALYINFYYLSAIFLPFFHYRQSLRTRKCHVHWIKLMKNHSRTYLCPGCPSCLGLRGRCTLVAASCLAAAIAVAASCARPTIVWLDEGCEAVAGDVCRDEAPLDAELAPDCFTLDGL